MSAAGRRSGEMPGASHEGKARVRNQVVKLVSEIGGDPRVLGGPDDAHRHRDITEALLILGQKALVVVGDLSVERLLALVGGPWLDQRLERQPDELDNCRRLDASRAQPPMMSGAREGGVLAAA
jgi:hypothetical protein